MQYSRNGTFSNSDVDALEDVITIHVRDNENLWLTFLVGTANLSAFEVSFRNHQTGEWIVIASVTADYTTPEGPVLGASGDLTVAASGSTPHFINLVVKGVHDVRLRAAGTSSTITGTWGAN